MTNATVMAKEKELTLLALGEKYSLVGDEGGLVRRICGRCLSGRSTVNPVRLYLEAGKPYDFFGMPVYSSEGMPADKMAVFNPIRDFESGLGVECSFDPATRTWYVREVVDPISGEPTGRFFFTKDEPLLFGAGC